MTTVSSLYTICYGAESVFGETTTTATTLQLQLAAPADTSGLTQDKIDPGTPKNRLMDGVLWINGVQGGTIKTKLWLTGHGSTTSGSTTVGLHETLIGKFVFGSAGTPVASASAGTTATGGTAAIWTTTASGTFAAGSMPRLGVLNDGKGGGQFYVVGTHTTTNLTPLNQPANAPANTDVIYSSVVSYLPSTTTAMSSVRLLCQGLGVQYLCHGCVPTAASLGGLNTGEVPFIEITWSVSWWEYSTATFPSAVSTEVFTPSANAAGSFWINAVGTATNATRTIRSLTIDWKIGTILLDGPGSPGQYGKHIGAVRGPDDVTVSWVEDADATTLTPVLPGYGTGTTAFHALYTLNPNAGKAVGFYWPNLVVNNVPTQMNDGGVNRFKITAKAYTGPTTTSELTSSAMRMAWA